MYGAQVSKDLNVVPPPAVGVRTPPQMSSPGLLRYRSAPSTLLGEACGDHAASAADTVIARFLAGGGGGGHHHEMRHSPLPSRPSTAAHFSDVDGASMVAVASHHQQQQLMYQSQQMAAMEGLYRTVSSGGGTEPTVAAASNSLLRQSSSPAGFLNHLTMDNGYGSNNMLRAAGSIGGGGGAFRSGGGDARLKGQLSFSSRQGSVMSQISEVGSEELGGSSPEACSNGGGGGYSSKIPGYPMGSAAAAGWEEEDQPPLPPAGATKRPRGDAFKPSAAAASSQEMAAMERFLQFQDAVPCKIRAKRGCATHPRSIAERVRRTRISERIRKLQELVPNMEKQTNTSDMLDLAVDYIKELQKHVKVLNDGRANCTCSASKQNHFAC